MKKLILVLAIALIASPVFAVNPLSVTLSRIAGTNVVDVNYTDANANNLPRAFALHLQSPGGTQFTGVSNYKTGESTHADPGYGIYPARIDINSAGVVNKWGTPLADSNVSSPADPGAGSPMPSNDIVLEFASLYYNDGIHETNAPNTSGRLCSLAFSAGAVSNPVITMTDEITYRGGIVLENGQQDLTAADKSFTFTTLVAPPPPTNGLPTPNVTTASGGLTTPLSWTASAGATSYDVYFGTVLPGTPVNQAGTTFATGTMVQGKTYLCSIVAKNSAGSSAPLNWSFGTDCMKSTGQGYANWVSGGKPSCWGYMWQRMGDVDGKDQGTGITLKRIGSVDLGMFSTAFNKKRSAFVGNDICSDLDHLDQGTGITLKAIGSVDLSILSTNFNKKSSALPNPPPYDADYYFYTVAP